MNSQQDLLDQFIRHQKLPDAYGEMAQHWFIPLAQELAQHVANTSGSLLVGVNGCQGSGKSTLCALLETLLSHQHQLSTVTLSIDDFYLTKTERQSLAEAIHPLFITRGVPGTHDTALLQEVINGLQQDHANFLIPRFNKALDDRFDKNQWDKVKTPVDVILLEGWCVGSPAQTENELTQPANTLEQHEDSENTWRSYSNRLLGSVYQDIFKQLNYMIFLQAPDFNCVYQWRKLQEDKLRQAHSTQDLSASANIMSDTELERFIHHYQRITEHTLNHLGKSADIVFTLNSDHQIISKNSPL